MVIWEMTMSKHLKHLSTSDDQVHIHTMHWPLILVKFTFMKYIYKPNRISIENSGHKFGQPGLHLGRKIRAENLICSLSLTCAVYSFIFLPLLQFCISSFLLFLPLYFPYHTLTPFLPLCPAFHLAFLFLSSLSQQMKFPNLEVIFDIWKQEGQQQPVPCDLNVWFPNHMFQIYRSS